MASAATRKICHKSLKEKYDALKTSRKVHQIGVLQKIQHPEKRSFNMVEEQT